VQAAVHLLMDGAHDSGVAVAEVLAADAAGEVDVGAPVVGLDARASAPVMTIGGVDTARDT
jgi:hypothetical protein